MAPSKGSSEGAGPRTRQSYLESYRSDWAWYYARGLLENAIHPVLYIPALYEAGKYENRRRHPCSFPAAGSLVSTNRAAIAHKAKPGNSVVAFAGEVINTVAFMGALREALREDGIDLLYVQEHWSGRFDHIVRALDLPVVGADHGGVSKGVVKFFKRRAFEMAPLCYGQTQSECRMIERFGGRSKLQPNGCDVSEFFPDAAVQRGKTVLTVARLNNKHKRTSDLIQAMAELPEEWILDIVGTGPDRDMLEQLAARLNLSSRVRFHGFVGRAEVRDFLRRCGVYAMPSANEAVALAVLEAMACRSAVVLSKIRAFEPLVTDGISGRLVPVGNVKGFAAAIIDAWEHRKSFGQAAFDTVRTHYNTRVLYFQLAESLRDCLRQSGAQQ